MKKMFTEEMQKKIADARMSVLGTTDYGKYNMEMYVKSDKGVWNYVTYGWPMWNMDVCKPFFKKVKDVWYIVCLESRERLTLTKEVANVIGFEM